MTRADDAEVVAELRRRLDGRLGERASYIALIQEIGQRRLADAALLLNDIVTRGIALERHQPREFRDVLAALDALAQLRNPVAAPLVRRGFMDGEALFSEAGTVAAVGYLAAVRDRASAPGLIPLLSDGSAAIRAAAAAALGRLGRTDAAEALVGSLQDADASVAAAAACALARFGDDRARPVLEQMVRRQPRPDLIEALARVGDGDSAVRLARFAADADAAVRCAVAEALGTLDPRRFRAVLARRMDDPAEPVRAAARGALDEA